MFIGSYNLYRHSLQAKGIWHEVEDHLYNIFDTNGEHFNNIMKLSVNISNDIDRPTNSKYIALLNKYLNNFIKKISKLMFFNGLKFNYFID